MNSESLTRKFILIVITPKLYYLTYVLHISIIVVPSENPRYNTRISPPPLHPYQLWYSFSYFKHLLLFNVYAVSFAILTVLFISL